MSSWVLSLLPYERCEASHRNSSAEKANVSRSHISSIEAPGIARPFSLEVFFNIADALEIAACRSFECFHFS